MGCTWPAVEFEPHPWLEAGLLLTDLPLRDRPSPEWLVALLADDADTPLGPPPGVRDAVRALLRHGGYKPAGRGKPASEYLARAAAGDGLRSINLAVDVCNAVSLHSGLPISVIDLGRAVAPLRVGIAAADAEYVFNPAGQQIRLGGLLCLHDASGPCANAVKDAQRTKTDGETTRTLTVIWGTRAIEGLTARALAWYGELCERVGGVTESRLHTPERSA